MSEIKNIVLSSTEEALEKAISPFIEEQFPSFVQTDYRKLVLFIKAYYEWMDSVGKPSYAISNLQSVSDIDNNVEEFYDHFKNTYLIGFPEVLATNTSGNKPNKNTLLKKIRDFYGNKGTESAYKFLFRVLYDSDLELYEPKKDILSASDGKWIEPRSIKTTSSFGSNLFAFKNGELLQYNGTQLIARAFIEDIVQYNFYGYDISEVFIGETVGDFLPNKPVVYSKDGSTLEESVFSVLGQFYIELPGSEYSVGDTVVVVDQVGVGFSAKIQQVDLAGGVKKISITNSGLNYYQDVVLDIYNANGKKNSKVIALVSAITEYPGYFEGNRGKLSSNKRIQDGTYYQQYSYVLKTRVSLNDYYQMLRRVIHPAGMKVIGAVLVNSVVNSVTKASSQATFSETPVVGRYAPYSFRTFNDLRSGYFLPNQIHGATLQVWLSGYNINGSTLSGSTDVDDTNREVYWGVRYWNSLHNGITFEPANASISSAPSSTVYLTPRFKREAVNTHPSVVVRPDSSTAEDSIVSGFPEYVSSGFLSTNGISMQEIGITTDSRSYFAVIKPVSISAISSITQPNKTVVGDTKTLHGIIVGKTGTNDNSLKVIAFNALNLTNQTTITASLGSTGEYKLICNTFSTSGNKPMSLFVNGVCGGTVLQAVSPDGGITSARLGIGCAAYSVETELQTAFDGEIAEVLLYQGDVGTTDRQKIEGYLAHKYGLAAKLPSAHPYRTSPPGASFSSGKWYGATADFYPNGYNPYINNATDLGPDGTSAALGSLFIGKGGGYTYTVVSEHGRTAHNPAGSALGGITAWKTKKETNPNISNIPGMVLWLKPENIGVCGSFVSGASVDVWRDASPSANHALPPTWDKWNEIAKMTRTTLGGGWNQSVWDATNPVTKVSWVGNGFCGGWDYGRIVGVGLATDPAASSSLSYTDYAWYRYGPHGTQSTFPRHARIYEGGPPTGNQYKYRADFGPHTDTTVFTVEYKEPYIVYSLDGVEKYRTLAGYGNTYYFDSTFWGDSSADGITGTSITVTELSFRGRNVAPSFTASSAAMHIQSYAGQTLDKLRPVLQFATSAGATGVSFNGGVLFSPSTIWTSSTNDGYTLGGLIDFGFTYGNGVTAARIMTGQHLNLTNPIELNGDMDVFMVFRSTSDSYDSGLGLFGANNTIAIDDHVLFNRSYNSVDREPSFQNSSYYTLTPAGTFLYPSIPNTGLVGFRPAGNKTNQQRNSISYDPHVSGVCMGTVVGEWVRDNKNRIFSYLNGDASTNQSETIGRRISRIGTPSSESFLIGNGLVNSFDPNTQYSALAIQSTDSNLLTPHMRWKHTHVNWIRPYHSRPDFVYPDLIWMLGEVNAVPSDPNVTQVNNITNNIDTSQGGYPLGAEYRFNSARTWEITPATHGDLLLYGGPSVMPGGELGGSDYWSPWNASSAFVSTAWSFNLRIKRVDGTAIAPGSIKLYIDSHGQTGAMAADVVSESSGWYRVGGTRYSLLPRSSPEWSTFWQTPVTRVGIGGLVPGQKYLVSFPELTTGYLTRYYGTSSSQTTSLPIYWTDTSLYPSGWGLQGSMEENSIQYITNPWGKTSLGWVAENRNGKAMYQYDAVGNTLGYLDGGGDGGYNSPSVSIDRTKTYRFSVWARAATPELYAGDPQENTRGRFYFGLYARKGNGIVDSVSRKDGIDISTSATNPYFTSTLNYAEGGSGGWSLWVGHVHPYGGDTGENHPNTGRYTVGSEGISASPAPVMYDYVWGNQSTDAQNRAYLYYSSSMGEKYEFMSPRIDCLDGNEPTIEDLLNNRISSVDGGGERGTDMTVFDSAEVDGANFGVFSLDGRSHVTGNATLTIPDSCTWEAWVNCEESINDYNMFMGRYVPYFSFLKSSDPTKFYIFYNNYLTNPVGGGVVSTTVSTPSELSLNKWYYMVITQNYSLGNTTTKIYINGNLRSSAVRAGRQYHYDFPLTIGDGRIPANIYGTRMSTQWYPFKGKVGPVRLYSRVLNEDEIEQNYNALRYRFGV